MAETANPILTRREESGRARSPWTSPASLRASHTLAVANNVLDVLETRDVSPAELRVLLALRGRDLEVRELARRLNRHETAIRRIAGRLYARGFLSWRYRPSENNDQEPDDVLGLRRAGRATIRPLLERG